MHRGVREFVRWLEGHADHPGVVLQPPSQVRDVQAIEHQVGSPLPADLRLVLGRFNGATTPAGVLLTAAPGPGATIEAALKEVAAQRQASFLDPELLLPFLRTEHGTILAFDRSAAPIADTWPIVDYDPETGEVRLVHRTFDGWCRLCVDEWTAENDTAFDLDKYLRQGERHVAIEPDVSIAHVTVGHALRRAGRPEEALASYLRGGRCIPAIPWADWEALKLATILGDEESVVEAAGRLAKRTPTSIWSQRGTTPSRAAFLIARVRRTLSSEDAATALERALTHLGAQAVDEDDAAARDAIVAASASGASLPSPHPPLELVVPDPGTPESWWQAMQAAYIRGALRDDDLALDARYDALRERYDFANLLRIRREF